MKNYKIFIFIPKDYIEQIIHSLQEFNVNKLGNYINCMSWCEMHSTWTSLDEAKPFIGKPGKVSMEEEYRLEFLCEESKVDEVVKYLKGIHPYEEPEIDVFELKEGSSPT